LIRASYVWRMPPIWGRGAVEQLRAAIHETVLIRQRLRERGASDTALELNRREIVTLQWALSRALAARYAPARSAPAVPAAIAA
jgi:hypothetical protein